MSGIVGKEVAIRAVSRAEPDFNARFSARWRRYRYTIDLGLMPDPLRRRHSWHPGRAIDTEALHQVAFELVGEHDFSSFCRASEGRTNVRRVESAEWRDEGEFIEFWIEANAFCHQMVRSLVGFSYDVARGFTPLDSVSAVIEARDRRAVSTVAPPHGLTLWEVGY